MLICPPPGALFPGVPLDMAPPAEAVAGPEQSVLFSLISCSFQGLEGQDVFCCSGSTQRAWAGLWNGHGGWAFVTLAATLHGGQSQGSKGQGLEHSPAHPPPPPFINKSILRALVCTCEQVTACGRTEGVWGDRLPLTGTLACLGLFCPGLLWLEVGLAGRLGQL